MIRCIGEIHARIANSPLVVREKGDLESNPIRGGNPVALGTYPIMILVLKPHGLLSPQSNSVNSTAYIPYHPVCSNGFQLPNSRNL